MPLTSTAGERNRAIRQTGSEIPQDKASSGVRQAVVDEKTQADEENASWIRRFTRRKKSAQ